VVGDGEIAWIGILKLLEKQLAEGKNELIIDELIKIKGIAVLKNNELIFTGYGQRLPSRDMVFPSYDYLETGLLGKKEAINNYFRRFDTNIVFAVSERSYEKERKPMVANIFLSKGCVSKCTFCQRGSKGYNVYDLDKLETHLKMLRDNYNVGFLIIGDENFGSNKKHTYQAVEIINKYNFLWVASGVRCVSVTKEDLLFYKKNGCCCIIFGIESGSQAMLDLMEKKFTVADIKKAIFSAYDIGLYTLPLGFMLGMPGESLKTARESGKLMGEISARLRVPAGSLFKNTDLNHALPLVGTPLYEYGKQLGLIGETVDDEERYLESTSNVAMYKRYYINLNGAPMSEVVFWDILVFMEATRTYVKFMKNIEIDQEMNNKLKRTLEIQALNPHVRARQKNIDGIGAVRTKLTFAFDPYFITKFLKQNVVFDEIIAKLPRFLIDPIVRYALYLEYLIQKNIFKDPHNLHKIINSRVDRQIRIKYDQIDPAKTMQKERSLRSMVNIRMQQLNMTEQEKIASALSFGP